MTTDNGLLGNTSIEPSDLQETVGPISTESASGNSTSTSRRKDGRAHKSTGAKAR